jgi:hypothetical protein
MLVNAVIGTPCGAFMMTTFWCSGRSTFLTSRTDSQGSAKEQWAEKERRRLRTIFCTSLRIIAHFFHTEKLTLDLAVETTG